MEDAFAFNIVTGRDPEAAANFGRSEHWGTDHRFDNAVEFIEIVKRLWDSWEDDALVGDKASGQFINPAAVHRINYKGEHYSVAGPLNIARPPQGPIPASHGRRLGSVERFWSAVRRRPVRYRTALGACESLLCRHQEAACRVRKRNPDDQALVTGIAVYVGHTAREAHDKYREIQNLTVTNYDLTALSGALGVDLTGYRLDTPISEVEELAD